MEITSIQIELAQSKSQRLKGFCRVVFDNSFLVNDIRILESDNGLFIAMPSRKITRPCPKCSEKNQLAAKFCNQCGTNLQVPAPDMSPGSRAFADVAHPINSEFREKMAREILDAYSAVAAGGPSETSTPRAN